jgi:multidrug resistance efflux pump
MARRNRQPLENSSKTRSETQNSTLERRFDLISSEELRTARQITLENMKVENLHKKGNDPDLPKVPGFEDLTELENQLEQMKAELDARRQELASRQDNLERRLADLEREQRALAHGVYLADLSKTEVVGVGAYVRGILDQRDAANGKILQVMHMALLRERFAKLWPTIKKEIEERIANLEQEIQELTAGGSNE